MTRALKLVKQGSLRGYLFALRKIFGHASEKTIRTKQGHTIEYHEIRASASKSLIDEIDTNLAKHYAFTPEELDFIINYDIKYRMGLASGVADESREENE